MPIQINRLPVVCTLHLDIGRLTKNIAYSNPPVQDVTHINTLTPHWMTDEHSHQHLKLFGAGQRFRSQEGSHQVLWIVGLQLRYYYFKILGGSQKALLSEVQFIARRIPRLPFCFCWWQELIQILWGLKLFQFWRPSLRKRIQNEVRKRIFI